MKHFDAHEGTNTFGGAPLDPHMWLDPQRMRIVLAWIRSRHAVTARPENAAIYGNNAAQRRPSAIYKPIYKAELAPASGQNFSCFPRCLYTIRSPLGVCRQTRRISLSDGRRPVLHDWPTCADVGTDQAAAVFHRARSFFNAGLIEALQDGAP